jgi:hypothetical protein
MVNKPFLTSKFRALAVLAALATVGLFASPAFPAAAVSAKTPARPALSGAAMTSAVAFSGQYSGKASLLIDNSTVTISSISGSGKNSLFGASKASGNGSAPKSSSSLCDPFGGKGSITGGANKITFVVIKSGSQQGCSSGESGAVTISFHGVAKASGGSGKGNGATGSLKFKGTLHLGGTSGAQSGNFTVSLSGELTVKS